MANASAVTGVSFNSAAVLFVQSANVTASRTLLPTTSLGDNWEFNIQGVGRVSGSIEVLYDKSDHQALSNHVLAASAQNPLNMTITWNTGEVWSGNSWVSEVSVTASTDELVKATISFSGNGAWAV